MDKKYKVYNRNKYDVGIQFMEAHKQLNIKAGSFALLSEDEISFLHSISTVFSGKDLCIDEIEVRENVLGFTSEEKVSLSEEEINAILKSSLPKMKASLGAITESNFKYLIFEQAKKLYSELTGAKIDFIAEYCEKDPEDLKPVNNESENKSE